MKILLILIMLILLNPIANAQTTYARDDAGLQGNAGATSGFFETYNPTNYPSGAAGWWHLLDIRHSNPTNNYAMQIAGSFYDQNFWVRKTNGYAQMPWSKVVTESQDGNVEVRTLKSYNTGVSINSNDMVSSTFTIEARTNTRSTDKGAALEFVIPANTDGTNLYGQGRILTVAANSDSYNATGKMIFGTRRIFSKTGQAPNWYYGDDIVIDGNGNIGINTLTPKEKLAVNGKIRAKEIKVEVANWPDYVFEDDHQLTSLPELEKYIQTNKHLPEVPTAKEVTANGIELGEMNKILLKKVEELTLLLIEQNKKFNSEITELKNKVDHLSKSKL